MPRLLRRTVIMREKDYDEKFLFHAAQLYDRVAWSPLSLEQMEQDNIVAILKRPDLEPPWKLNELQTMLWYLKEMCYNPRYPEWKIVKYNDELLICPNRSNASPSRLGIAVVEKDL